MNNASAASGRNDLGVWGGTVYPTFSSYQTASSQDANSFNATYNTTTTFSSGNLYPTNLFTNPAIGDLHIAYTNGTSAYQFVDARATPLASITTDYDYQTRDPLTPDIGADEFNECSHIVITSQPVAQVSCVGSTTKFAVNNTGTTPYTYNWQFSTNNGSTWSPLIIASPYATNISGDTLSIIGTPLTFNNYLYRVDVSNSCSDVVSTAALLTVMSGSSNVYLSTISDSMLVETCPDGSGWTYYSTYSDPTKWLFAINKNGNTFSATPILTMRFTGPTAYDSVSNPSNQTALYTMNRHWNVIMETGSIDSNLGKVSVRFFYNPADTIAMVHAAQAWVSGHPSTTSGYTTAAHSIEWFKTVHTSYVPSNNTSTYVPTAYTFDPSSYTYGVINGVNYVELDNIVSFSGGTAALLIEPTAGSAISLPVTLLYLTATAENNQFIQLNWATASEINNAGFDIERSIDGVNFASIGWSAGHGNSSVQNEYMYQDMAVQPDIVYYYRLKQVNVDGQFVYTYIVSSSLVGHAGLVFQDMKPNPAINTIQLAILSSSAQQMSVNITDMLGRSVLNTPWQLSIGYNVNTFDISFVASGTYNVTILQGTVSITKRLTITK